MKNSNTGLLCLIFFFAGALMTCMLFGLAWIANQDNLIEKAPVEQTKVEEVSKEEPMEEPQVTVPQVGEKAPDFTLANFDSEAISLSDFKGKKVVLNFFVSWCPYCNQEAPDLEKIHQEYKDEDVVVLTINLSQGEEKPEDVKAYIEKYGITTEVLLDLESHVAEMYNIQATPTNYFINRDGTIGDIYPGYLGYDEIKEKIEKLK